MQRCVRGKLDEEVIQLCFLGCVKSKLVVIIIIVAGVCMVRKRYVLSKKRRRWGRGVGVGEQVRILA